MYRRIVDKTDYKKIIDKINSEIDIHKENEIHCIVLEDILFCLSRKFSYATLRTDYLDKVFKFICEVVDSVGLEEEKDYIKKGLGIYFNNDSGINVADILPDKPFTTSPINDLKL